MNFLEWKKQFDRNTTQPPLLSSKQTKNRQRLEQMQMVLDCLMELKAIIKGGKNNGETD
jgi:hypothetical protein